MTSLNGCSVIQFFIYLIGVRSRDHLRANQIAPGRNHVTRPASHATTQLFRPMALKLALTGNQASIYMDSSKESLWLYKLVKVNSK